MSRMVEPGDPFGGVFLSLTLDSPILDVDRRLATRRTGMRSKGEEAWVVLERAFGITTVGQLLEHYPRRYIDRSRVEAIRDLRLSQQATVIATVRKVAKRMTRRRQTMVTVTVGDGTGYLDLTFFNQPWAASTYREGVEVALSGVVTRYRGRLQLANQEAEILRGADADLVHTGRITPVHPASDGITTRTIRELVHRALERLPTVVEQLPADIVKAEGLGGYDRSIRDIHFPASPEDLAGAIERLKFDELFTLELGVAFRKHRMETERHGVAHQADGSLTRSLLATLPFEPTKAQSRAIEDVASAMARAHPMNVLLQGDVGAGKTLVALYAAVVAVQSGHQAAIMAPTEVLAGQHLQSVASLLEGMGASSYLDLLRIAARKDDGQVSLLDGSRADEPAAPTVSYALLTASVTGRDRARIVEGIAKGDVDLVIGTHALVQEGVQFADLSLAIVDEQHRFGLHQRMALSGKGVEPDALIMTATPIPRTLALTYYGDLDVVVLDELPKGRRPVQTRVVREPSEREAAYDVVRREALAGRQAFVVCAAIDEGNRLQVKAAEQEAERLASRVFPELQVDVLHGRMRPADKEARMAAFREGRSHLLISTTVIEVGVDIPNATVMLVENAERFGLAQLHQLRGRIGRGAHESFCFLFDESDEQNPDARARLDAMVRTTDGFELADDDLRLRGEGTLFDVRQSGMPDLKLARLAEDLELVRRARAQAFALVGADPELDEHPDLLVQLRRRFAASIEWLFKG